MALDKHPGSSLSEECASALAWWRECGVEHAFLDAPQRLLPDPIEAGDPAAQPAAPPPVPQPVPATVVPQLVAEADLPATLEDFRRWWLDPQMPLPRLGAAIAPTGAVGAKLLMLVPMPEAGDTDLLLQGQQGRLLAGIARALGLAPGEVYLASALPAAMAMPDWAQLAERGLAQVVRHHLALAQPQKVLVFGGVLAQMLDIAHSSADTALMAGGRRIPVLAADAPEHLLHHRNRRARLWQRLLDWTAP